jgi:signal transduction histidine kinase/CheY-like chemotaxis protein
MDRDDDTERRAAPHARRARETTAGQAVGATVPATARVPDWLSCYLAHAPRAVAVVDGAAHRVLAANGAFRRLVAARDERPDPAAGALVGRPVTDACAPGGAPALRALLDRVRRTGAPADGVVSDAHADYDGAWQCTVWACAVAAPAGDAPDDAGGGRGAHAVGPLVVEVRAADAAERAGAQQRDLTGRLLLGALREHRLAEEAERREAELTAMFESLPDAVYLGTRDDDARADDGGGAGASGSAGPTGPRSPGLAPPRPDRPGRRTPRQASAPRRRPCATPRPARRSPRTGSRSPARSAARASSRKGVLRDPATGEDRAVRCAAAPVVVDGRVVAAVVVHTDVTAQRRLEAELRQAQKLEAVGRLAGGVAHDFNNLLTTIAANAELAALELPPDSPAHADLGEVATAVGRAAALTRQLLAFSRQQVLRPTRLDLGAVVADVERLLARVLGGDVVLTTRHDPGCPAVVADRGQLEQVLMNLAVNARAAMPQGGTFEITTARVGTPPPSAVPAAGVGDPSAADAPPAWAALCVRDTGLGMDAATRARIFEPFFTTRALGEGTGLGLATVYGIVAQSGGRLDVETAPGVGTAFTIYLPAHVPAAHPGASLAGDAPDGDGGEQAFRPDAPPRGTGTVLLVDDDAMVRRAVARLLAERGYTVIEAGGGAEALALAAGSAPGDAAPSAAVPLRALITDVRMPGMRGPDLAARLRASAPGLRVLLMSGYAADAPPPLDGLDGSGARRAGVSFLAKPFSAADLAAALRALLDGADPPPS